MHNHQIYRIDERGEKHTVVHVPGRPSGLGFLPDGDLLYVSMEERALYRHDDRGSRRVADLRALAPGDLNDMVVDGSGRAYVGNFGAEVEPNGARQPTCLVLVTPDGKARVVAEDLAFPNGTVILPGGRTLVVAETMGQRLTAFDIEADGALSGRRCFAELPGRAPDGIAVDAEGAIWVSCFLSDEFVRVHDGGAISARVDVAGRRAVSCALGGADRRTLFMLTAETNPEELMEGLSHGAVERARVEVAGAGYP